MLFVRLFVDIESAAGLAEQIPRQTASYTRTTHQARYVHLLTQPLHKFGKTIT